ncbi:hypothetical protein VIGAN_04073200 [Vigna angularis var. angularis]|uniref:Uncharacterized protein n=1 Tax=Vigna angularis var. angularis TaxID=157739 RepID=A0A0S3RSM3_PHAAN|nr:hypothetical protein VIGAN_04073200 [Vigna angularis var. angularis]
MEVEDGRPWGITISVVEVQRPVEQRRTTNNHGSRCSLLRHDALADELAMLKQVNEFAAKGLSPPRKNGFARCQLWEKDMEIREMKDQIKELVGLLRQSEMKRKEVDKELKVREQANGSTLATPPSHSKARPLLQLPPDWHRPNFLLPAFLQGMHNHLLTSTTDDHCKTGRTYMDSRQHNGKTKG